MTRNSARMLPRGKLERILRGLRLRMADGTQKTAERLETLSSELAALVEEVEEANRIDHSRHASEQAAAMTAWDEQRCSVWDHAERRSFKAVHGTAIEQRHLRAESKRRVEEATVELKRRIAEIEKRFLRSKDKTVFKLNQRREQIEQLAGKLAVVQQETTTFLAKNGVQAQPMVTTPPQNPQATAVLAIEACAMEIEESRQQLHRLEHHRILRAIESVWFWLLCGAVGASLAGLLGGLSITPWLIAIVSGVIVAVVLGIAAILAVHPLIRRHVRSEYPRLESSLAEAVAQKNSATQLTISENDASLKRLAQKRDDRYMEASQWREQIIKETNDHQKREMIRLRTFALTEQATAKEQLTDGMARVDQQSSVGWQQAEAIFAATLSERQANLATERSRIQELMRSIDLVSTQRVRVAAQRAASWIARARRWSQTHFPRWEQIANDEPWQLLSAPVLPLGSVRVESFLPEPVRLDAGGVLAAPVTFEPFVDQYLTITADPSSTACQQLIKSIVLRALTTLPPGKTQIAVVDPPGLGRDYGWLMHLGDFDPELVTHRVWTQSNHIAKHLTNLALRAEDFIQQSLRNQYATIEQYNRDAGPLAEPFRLLIWTSFPLGLDDQSWKPLQSLLDTGARCGIIPIFILDPALPWDTPERRELLMRRGLHVTLEGTPTRLLAQTPNLATLPIELPEAPTDVATEALVRQIGRRALLASRVEVPLAGITVARSQWWQADSTAALEIPIGQSGVGRIQSLKLGIGTAQHAIVAGKTGSGKSTMLHAIITSAAIKYSPERLRMVLLDFKKGVEFQAYSQAELPHADIIGIESHREFGLSALEYVDQCMQQRGQLFRQAGVQDLQSWNLIKPEHQMPRMLIVVDEFQELFVEDDKLTSQVSLILDRIVRQGRSFGFHAVLSSQTLAGAYSLPRTTMGQMAVRIALQCDAADAQLIFADDNPAASRLNHPGQAVYNDQGGRVEGNQAMQIGWLNKSDMMQWLADLPFRGYRNTDSSTNLLGRCVVFDGNRAAVWNRDAALKAIESARADLNPEACWCVVGESVAISPAVSFPLTDQAGRNAMLVGGEDAQTASVVLSIAGSFVAHHAMKHLPHLFLIQAAKPTDALCLGLAERMRKLPAQVSVADARTAEELLGELHTILKSRIDAPDGYDQWQPILLSIINIGRLRGLRPEDEYGLGSLGESKLTPDKQLEELLRDGPSHHIHVLIAAENANTIGRWLGRSSQREIEIRLLMQMSANDSTHLIDSIAASHLGAHVMLMHDDATSTQSRFRPYDYATLVDLAPSGNMAADR